MLIDTDKNNSLLESKLAYSVSLAEYEEALQKIQNLESLQQASNHRILSLEEEIKRLREQLQHMQHQRFGKKSEKEVGEPSAEANNGLLQTVSGYTRKKGSKTQGRTIDTSTLPRHKFYHDLPEGQKNCKGCHNPLERIGQDVSEQLEVLPLQLYVAEHIRYKYACRCCQTLEMAPKPKAPIPKALAGGSLLTEIIVNKYQYHLPLYRQSKILASYNALIPDNTLGNWVMASGNGLMLVYEALWKAILETRYLQVDETPVKILKPEKKGYLWTYFAPHLGAGLVIFELSLTRGAIVPEERLASFKGLLQTDGYGGYNGLRKRDDITGFGCLSHARRKFSEVLKISKNPSGVAAQLIERLKPVYALEDRMREQNLSFHTRKRLRQKQAWPILKEIRPWLKQQLIKTPPKSKLGGAIEYTLKQWRYIIAYLRHGSVEIDTNLVENKIRPVALGRRNWLFMGHEDSGKFHALWYSLVLSAMMNGLNPRVYVHYLLTQTHALRTKSVKPESLLPHVIDRNKLKIFADEQIALAKHVLDSS
jgi:transposase